MDVLKILTTTLVLFAALGLTMPAHAGTISSTAAIANLVPTVEDIAVPASVAPTAGGDTAMPVTVTVKDDNGHQDVVSVEVFLYDAANNVVQGPFVATSNNDGSGTGSTFGYTFQLPYHLDAGDYNVGARVTDSASGVSPIVKSTAFTYEELAALALSANALDFGTMDPGQRSATQGLTVSNHGNVQIDLVSSGTDLVHSGGAAIDKSNVKYDLVDNTFANELALTGTAFTNAGFDLAKGDGSSKETYWALNTPSGEEQYLPAGSYDGTVTLTAIKG